MFTNYPKFSSEWWFYHYGLLMHEQAGVHWNDCLPGQPQKQSSEYWLFANEARMAEREYSNQKGF